MRQPPHNEESYAKAIAMSPEPQSQDLELLSLRKSSIEKIIREPFSRLALCWILTVSLQNFGESSNPIKIIVGNSARKPEGR